MIRGRPRATQCRSSAASDMYKRKKVDSSVCPTHFSQRKPVKLVIGEDYYVSFGNNEAHRCKLVDIPEMYQGQRIKIETPTPRGSITHILFADEIGTTPDEAVMNQVTM